MNSKEALAYAEQRYGCMPPSVQMTFKEYLSIREKLIKAEVTVSRLEHLLFVKETLLTELVSDVAEELDE